MPSSGMLFLVALVRTDFSEEPIVSIIRATIIGELGATLTVTSNRSTLRRNTNSIILIALMMEEIGYFETSDLKEAHSVTFQKTAFFIVTAVKTSYLT
jgi:hypothetical protein